MSGWQNEWMKIYTCRMKISTQNHACSLRQIHAVHTCRLSQVKTTKDIQTLVKYKLSVPPRPPPFRKKSNYSNYTYTHTHTHTPKRKKKRKEKKAPAERSRTKRYIHKQTKQKRHGRTSSNEAPHGLQVSTDADIWDGRYNVCKGFLREREGEREKQEKRRRKKPVIRFSIETKSVVVSLLASAPLVYIYKTYRLLVSSLCPEVTLCGWQDVKIQEVST